MNAEPLSPSQSLCDLSQGGIMYLFGESFIHEHFGSSRIYQIGITIPASLKEQACGKSWKSARAQGLAYSRCSTECKQ